MPATLPIAGTMWWLGLATLNKYAQGGTAVSEEALCVQKNASEVREMTERSEALFGKKSAAISNLYEVITEHDEEASSVGNMQFVDPTSVFYAELFIRAIPSSFRLPEFTIDPDGAISLDWIPAKHQIFSLSIGRNTRLAFAWLDGTDKGHGVARFDGQQIPARIYQVLKPFAT